MPLLEQRSLLRTVLLATLVVEMLLAAIAYQVTNGKGAMPAFGGRLSDADIANVAAYVASQAESGW